jgi:hypothetical protein
LPAIFPFSGFSQRRRRPFFFFLELRIFKFMQAATTQ